MITRLSVISEINQLFVIQHSQSSEGLFPIFIDIQQPGEHLKHRKIQAWQVREQNQSRKQSAMVAQCKGDIRQHLLRFHKQQQMSYNKGIKLQWEMESCYYYPYLNQT